MLIPGEEKEERKDKKKEVQIRVFILKEANLTGDIRQIHKLNE